MVAPKALHALLIHKCVTHPLSDGGQPCWQLGTTSMIWTRFSADIASVQYCRLNFCRINIHGQAHVLYLGHTLSHTELTHS